MFQKLMDDVQETTGVVVRKITLAAAMALSLFITFSFLSAAAFVFVLQNYGPIEACFTGAAIFFVLSLVAASCYAASKSKIKPKPAAAPKSPLSNALSDPMVMAIGLQAVRAIGIKRLVPLLAIGGIALGLMSQRRSENSEPEQ